MLIAVVAKKPSVAHDLDKVLAQTRWDEDSLDGNGCIITWAVGHLGTLAEPPEINSGWKHWYRLRP